MKNIFCISFVALLGMSVLTSCSDFLEAENKSAGSDSDTYFATETGISEARVQAYAELKNIASNTDLTTRGTDLYITVRGKTTDALDSYSHTSSNSDVTNFYEDCYGAINSANFLVQVAEEGSIEAAEGKFLRDYVYYVLTQQFGAVPYFTHYISDSETSYPRVSLDEIYPALIEELEDIYSSSSLPSTDYSGYVSKQAVAALLAHLYLAEAWDVDTSLGSETSGTYTVNSTSNFSKAAQWAVSAINGISLTQSFEDKWLPSNEGNVEQIFSVQYDRANNPGSESSGGHGLQNYFGSYYGECTATGYKNAASEGAMSEKALYLWDEGDERYDGTFMTKMYNYDGTWGTTGYFAYYNATAASLANMPYGYRYFPAYTTAAEAEAEFAADIDKYTQGSYNNTIEAYILSSPAVRYVFNTNGTYTKSSLTFEELCARVAGGTCVRKWDDKDALQETTSTNSYRDIVIFDLSEIYLVAAEAYLLAGDQSSALGYVNAVRTRANAGTLSSFSAYDPLYSTPSSFGDITALDCILDERARELYGQLDRWVTLRRTKQLVRYNVAFNLNISSVSDMQNTYGETKWYRPIPSDEISANTGISEEDQNAGY